MLTRRIFISSTVYDLKLIRNEIRSFLESAVVPGVKLKGVMSEAPDFGVPPNTRATRHSYDICIDRLVACDFAIFLIGARYGRPLIRDEGAMISITHLEFRAAVRRCMPRFVFVNSHTWDARLLNEKGQPQSHVPSDQLQIFDFINEVHRSRPNWLSFYRNTEDILLTLQTDLLEFDDSDFVADLGVADGAIVPLASRFTKTWQIRNNGLVAWKNRKLCEDNAGASGLVPDQTCVPIPDTMPGQIATISVSFTAPQYSATCKSVWRMLDEYNRYCFPRKVGIWCQVKATHR